MQKKVIVVKIGTKVIAPEGLLDKRQMLGIVQQVKQLLSESRGMSIILVSSGAVAAGRALFKNNLPSKDWPAILNEKIFHKQLLAGIGQTALISKWDELFNIYGLKCAQVLVTSAEFEVGAYAQELKEKLLTWPEMGVVPVLNENDVLTRAGFENGFTDNDEVALKAAKLLEAETLIFLSDCDGYVGTTGLICELTGNERCSDRGNTMSRGGMSGKIKRCHEAMGAGINVYIANGKKPDVLADIIGLKLNPGTVGYGRKNRIARKKSRG